MFKKRILSIVLLIAMLINTAMPVFATEEVTDNGLEVVQEETDVLDDATVDDFVQGDEEVISEAESVVNVADTLSYDEVISYVYIESPEIASGNTQRIGIILNEDYVGLDNYTLSYIAETTGSAYEIPVLNVYEDTLFFEFDVNEQKGVCKITELSFVNGDGEQKVVIQDDHFVFDVNQVEENDIVASDASENSVVTGIEVDGIAEAVTEGLEQSAANIPAAFSRLMRTNNIVIAIDAGHDSSHAGAEGHGIVEQVVNLKLAQYVKEELEKYEGVTVYMTRTGPDCPYPETIGTASANDIKKRIDAAVEQGARAVVSLHLNSFTSPVAHGSVVFTPIGNDSITVEAENLSDDILDKLCAVGFKNGGHRQEDYAITTYSHKKGIPGIIVEHGFLSNPDDAAKLNDEAHLKAMGIADAQGIANFYGLNKKEEFVNDELVIEGGEYYIASAKDPDMTLDIEGSSSDNWSKASLTEYKNTASQHFMIEAVSDGYYKIINKNSSKSLDIYGGYTDNGNQVQQYEWNGTDAQMWKFMDAGNGYYYIVSKIGTYLTRSESGTNIESHKFIGAERQAWKLSDMFYTHVEDGKYVFESCLPGESVISVVDDSKDNLANIAKLYDDGKDSQEWAVTHVSDGYYKIINIHSGKAMTVDSSNKIIGANIHQCEWNETDSQLWRFIQREDGAYYLKSKLGVVLDAPDAADESGTNIETNKYTGADSQYWKLRDYKRSYANITNNVYVIESSLAKDMVLSVENDLETNFANVCSDVYSHSLSQQWSVEYVSDGWYKILSQNTKKALDVYGSSKENGANVQQYEWNGTNAQLWRFIDAGDGYYYIQNATGKYLDIYAASPLPHANVQLYQLNKTPAQKWKLNAIQEVETKTYLSVEDGYYVIESVLNPLLVLSVENGSGDNFANVCNETFRNMSWQTWHIELVGDDWYKIVSYGTKKSLDVYSGSTENGTNVQQYEWNGTDAQLWRFVDAGNGECYLECKTGKNLTVADGNSHSGANVYQYEWNRTDDQKWLLVKTEERGDIPDGFQTLAGKTYYFKDGELLKGWQTINGDDYYFDDDGVMQTNCTIDGIEFGTDGKAIYTKRDVEEGVYMISVYDQDAVLSVCSGAREDGVAMELDIYGYKVTQQYEIKEVEDGWYTIVNMRSGKALTVRGNSKELCVGVEQRTYDGKDGQQWQFIEGGDGYCYIKSKLGTVLDCPAGSMIPGTLLNMYSLNRTNAQKWKVEPAKEPNLIEFSDGVYQVFGYNTDGKALSVSGYSMEDWASVTLNTPFGHPGEQFEIKSLDNGWYSIINVNSGKAFDVIAANAANWASVHQYEYNGTDAQQWRFIDAGNGYVYIQSRVGTVLDRPAGSKAEGTVLHMYSINHTEAQKWKIGEVQGPKTIEIEDGSVYLITTALNGAKVLDVVGESKDNWANIQLWQESVKTSQQFRIIEVEDGWYKLESVKSGKVLDVYASSKENGANVQQYEWNGSDAQLWRFIDAGDGYVYIQSKVGTVLDCASGQSANGTNIQMYTPNRTDAQRFKLHNISGENRVYVTDLADYMKRVTLYNPSIENIQSVEFPTWSDVDGQDDLKWFQGTKNADGSWSVIVNAKDFDAEDTFKVVIHIYINTAGESKLVAIDNTYLTQKEKEMVWPTPSSRRITSYFGYREQPTAGASTYHQGIDIGAGSGSDIVASLDGIVKEVGYNEIKGNYVILDHGDGICTSYLHMSKSIVKNNQTVTAGQVIGYVGTTGVATGPHLHFSLIVNNNNIDPLPYLNGEKSLDDL